MTTYLAEIDVSLRPGVFDPQGQAVAGALEALGLAGVAGVRIGKHIELRVCAEDRAAAEASVERACRELLVSPVLEDYRFRLTAEAPKGESASSDGRRPASPPGSG